MFYLKKNNLKPDGTVNEVFQLPENIKPLAIIPLGYPSGKPTSKDKFDEASIHYNKWD